ncbi:hypothetical protein [Formosa sp. A9]|uniref:hypothetical protein n=1 Tax=Formosa sp. A9 TaxID=3442641 RepID=UPI003EBEB8A8
MTEKRNLEVLNFYISPKGKRKEKILLSDFLGEDFLNVLFNDFVPFLDRYPRDENNKRVFKLFKEGDDASYFSIDSTYRSITGIVETGKYGKEENVVDSNKPNDKPVFKINKNHAVQKPFFFLVCVSNKKTDNLLILERDGVLGIKQVFTKFLKDFISTRYPDYRLHVYNFIDTEIIKNYITKGDYKSITLSRNSLPHDVAERYNLNHFESRDFIVELKIKTKGSNFINGYSKKRILEIFANEKSGFFTSEELKQVGFDDKSTIKVDSRYNNSKRVINLSETMKFRPYYDILVNINPAGHSEFDSIETEAFNLIDELQLELY